MDEDQGRVVSDDRAGGADAPEPVTPSQPVGAHPSRWPSVEWDDDGYPEAEDDDFSAWASIPLDFRLAGHFLIDELQFAATQCCCYCDVVHIDGVWRIAFSTGGWSGAESLLAFIESRLDTSHFMTSWRRGGHYEFEIRDAYLRARDSDGNPKGGDGTAPSRSDDSVGAPAHRPKNIVGQAQGGAG